MVIAWVRVGRRIVSLVVLAAWFGACSGAVSTVMAQTPSPAATPAASVKVVATFSILGDWVQQVGGDRIELVTLVGAGGDAHTFDPSPDEAAQLAGADLIVEVGAEFEPWLNDLVAAADAPAHRVAITDGLDLIPLAEDADGHDAEEHEHAAGDPHVWHDVANAIASVETIRDALSAIDAANAPVYAVNAGRYIEELRALDREIRGQTATLPEERRRLVTSHDTFAYYARAYGFEIVGTALGSVTTEAGEPSAQQFASLVEQIEAAGVPAIFAENVANPDLMQSIADEAGVTLAPPLYTDALSEPSGPASTYIALMRTNTTTIVTALAA